MGMDASQVRLLGLTARRNDIGRELQHLSNNKQILTREMQKVSKDYQNALSSKTIMWSNNSGLTYTDITYGTLMRPGAANNNNPVLLTDAAGKIVLDEKYKQYAEMLSPDGNPGGKWEDDTRLQILSALTGIPVEQFETEKATSDVVADKRDKLDKAEKAITDFKGKSTFDAKHLVHTFLNSYKNDSTIINSTNIAGYAQSFKEAFIGKNYFSTEDEEKIKNIIEQDISEKGFNDKMFNKSDDEKNSYKLSDLANDIAKNIISTLTGNHAEDAKLNVMYDNKTGQGTKSEYDALVAARDAAQKEYDSAVGVNAQVFNGTQDLQIQFYDRLFEAIAEFGWVNDNGVEDSEYLSQMLQNNSYYVTTMTKNDMYDSTQPKSSKNNPFYYDTDIASNFDNMYIVNNTAARDEALAKYEYEKSLINSKEQRIDTRMKDLETEQAAIQKMIETDKTFINDNIDRTFGIFA